VKRFIEGEDRAQVTLLPACLEDYVEAENPVRVVEAFVDGLDLGKLDFGGIDPAATGRPAYHPAVRLKLYICGCLNRIPSSRRLEREAVRNVELMWLTGRLTPDFKTIANFRKDNGRAIRKVCRQFIVLCRQRPLSYRSTGSNGSDSAVGIGKRGRVVASGGCWQRWTTRLAALCSHFASTYSIVVAVGVNVGDLHE